MSAAALQRWIHRMKRHRKEIDALTKQLEEAKQKESSHTENTQGNQYPVFGNSTEGYLISENIARLQAEIEHSESGKTAAFMRIFPQPM